MWLFESATLKGKFTERKGDTYVLQILWKENRKARTTMPYCGKEQGMLRVTDGYFGILENLTQSENRRRITEEKETIEEERQKREKAKNEDEGIENNREVERLSEDTAKLSLQIKSQAEIMNFEKFIQVELKAQKPDHQRMPA